MQLQAGNRALEFKVQDIFGKEVKLSAYKGKKIILSFNRNVSCPYCNRRVHEIMGNNYKLQQSGVQLIFFFESTPEKLLSSVFHQGISPWPLIGDPEKRIYEQYEVERSNLKMLRTIYAANLSQAKKDTQQLNLPKDRGASLNLIPADFFINEEFQVVKAHYGQHIDDHVSLEALKKFARID